MEKKRIAVAMSGGVDSSLTAALLQEQGHEVAGITMNLSDCSAGAVSDAKIVADFLGIPHHVADFRALFQKKVIDYFLDEYAAGRTPNPCVACNPGVKFGGLIAEAARLGYDYLATGHYAGIHYSEATGRYNISKGTDGNKDQAYALYRLKQEQLAHVITPLGGWVKTDTRAEAVRRNLPVANKPESQEICFVPDDYKEYLLRCRPELRRPGDIVDTSGRVLGRHEGVAFYTVGQRKGLGIAAEKPLYVIALDAEKNQVIAGGNQEVFSRELVAEKLNWVAIGELTEPMRAGVKIRYGAKEADALLTPREDGTVLVSFDAPQRAVTPGQSAVFYRGNDVLGGGIIREAVR
ncbi:tRNA 2-thiouridine(34) synthase MnmA [Anaerovibrio sp.]|uniref:tRNA 2-thiouridine(34) synthase MnmA n=1 Tax=Anaerovibrio sp. TaxID=1872532 RepID=UPI003F162445